MVHHTGLGLGVTLAYRVLKLIDPKGLSQAVHISLHYVCNDQFIIECILSIKRIAFCKGVV